MSKSSETAPVGDFKSVENPNNVAAASALTRRNFLRGAGGVAGLAVLGTTASGDRRNLTAESPQASPPHPELAQAPNHESGHEQSHISWLNFGTALGVTSVFGSEVWRNATESKHHQPFGMKSFLRMMSAEATRLGALSLGNHDDIHQRNHEAKDIFLVSYPLAGALTVLAEATSHIEADEKALFDNYAKLIDEEGDQNNTNIIPDALNANPEAWEAYYKDTEREIIRISAQNRVIGAAISPVATTYTSAELINAMNKRMSTALAKYEYAKQVHDVKQTDGMLDQDQLLNFMEHSINASDKHMHGKFGYVLNTMLNGGNIQGAGGIGDPPNFFYILRNGFGEWAKASAQGLATMNAMAHMNDSAWLAQVLGVSPKKVLEAQHRLDVEIGSALKDILAGSLKTLVHPDYAMLRFKKQGAMLDEILNNPENGYTAEHVSQIQAMLGDIKTTPFAYDWRGFMAAMKPAPTSKLGRLATFLSKSTGSFKKDKYKDLPGFTDENGMFNAQLLRPLIDELRGQAETEPTHGLIERFVATYAQGQKNEQVETLAKVLDNLLLDMNSDKRIDLERYAGQLNGITSLTGTTISDERLNEVIAKLETAVDNDGSELKDAAAQEAREKKNAEAFNEALDEITAGLGHLPSDSRKALTEFWARAIKADSVSGHTPANGLGHASREVLTALGTQIPAANAVAVTVRKLLELPPINSVPFEHKIELVMATAAGLSGVADNVVAYMYCEDVLLKEYQKEYGEDVFDRTPDLKNQLTRGSLFTAILGGALTKIGNGPNFKFQKHTVQQSFDKDTSQFTLRTHAEELPFKQSFNPKAVVNAVANTVFSQKMVIPKPQKAKGKQTVSTH